MYAKFEDIQKHLKTGIHHVKGYEPDTEWIEFYCNDGYVVTIFHSADCCETVKLENDDGLVNGEDIFTGCKWCKVTMSQMEGNEDCYGIEQWTFYLFQTDKGYDTMRWYGESNGYYSIEVAYDVDLWDIDTPPVEVAEEQSKFVEEYEGQKEELRNAIIVLSNFCDDQINGCDACPLNRNGECPFNKRQFPDEWKVPDILYDQEE